MKTRISLVSNSSSSSFIVVFPCKPGGGGSAVDDIHKWMFNCSDGEIKGFDDFSITYKQIVEVVAKDCEKKDRVTKKELLEVFNRQVYHEIWEYEEQLKKDENNTVQSLLDASQSFGIENMKILGRLQKIHQSLQELKRQEDVERTFLKNQYNIYNYKQEENKEYQDADLKLRQSYWKKQDPFNKQHHEIIDELAEIRTDQFINEHKGWWVVLLEYEDHSPKGFLMEYSNIFKHVEHIKINNH